MSRVEIITGRGKRRRWSADEKARLVAETYEPRAVITHVPRRNGVAEICLHLWRKQLGTPGAGAGVANKLIPVALEAMPIPASEAPSFHCVRMVHVRRKFFDVYQVHKGAAAKEVLKRIGRLYAVEDRVRSQPAVLRLARTPVKQDRFAAGLRDVGCRAPFVRWSRRAAADAPWHPRASGGGMPGLHQALFWGALIQPFDASTFQARWI